MHGVGSASPGEIERAFVEQARGAGRRRVLRDAIGSGSPLLDLRHGGRCRLAADGADIRIIQLMLGHASIQQTLRYLNVTDEELRKGLEVSWKTKAGRCDRHQARERNRENAR